MKYIKPINESNISIIENQFNYFKDCSDVMNRKGFEFLAGLNLTEDQYKELSYIIDDFGLFKYNEGYENSEMDDYYNEPY